MMNAARSIIGCLGILVLLAVTIGAKDFCGTERAMAKLTPAQKQQLRRYSVKGSVPANELLLYLHFTGATIRPGFANATGFVSPLVKGTSNVPPPTMTAAQIAETIELVKDDFSPFNIQITTDYNTFLNYPIAFKQIAIISTLPSTIGMSGVSGVSPWVGIGTRLFSNPSFTFASTLGNVPEDVANVISHEVGHGLGLTHQGRFTIGCAFDIEYQPNIGTGPLAFGPLMGEALAPSISNWWSQACTHPVDGGPLHDFSLISNQVVLRPDDVPNVAPGGSASTPFNGVIEKAGDSDLVRVTSGFADFLSVRSSNIDLVASVFATNGTLIGRYIDRDRSGLTFPIPSGASDIRIRPASNANMDAVFMTGRYRLTGLGSGGAINYTAIGDSLAFGTGAGTPASGGYVPRLRNKIATATGQSVTLDNRGNFGIFSSQLLTSVQTDAAMRASLQSADIITFNIGGNDLGLGRLNYRNNACGGADGQDCLRATATSLKANWDATVAELRTLNPDADIRTIDIYYPAVNFDSTQDSFPGDGLNDFQVLNSYLADFNAHVAVTSASNDIKRGHVHEAFNGSGGTNDPIAGGLIAADFTHPNDTGYELIAVKLFETDTVTFALDPEAVTLALGATQQFTRTGGTPPVVFSLVQNQSGGNVDASGLYTAGPNVGIDIVRVTDEDDATADASVRVSSDISCPDANTKVWDGGGDTNNWSEAANWCNNTVPTTHHSIIFNATSIKNLNINTNVTVASANITSLYTGTITQGTSNLNVTFSFTQAGGTFVAGSGSITVGTTHSHAGGTFSGGFGGLDIEGGFDISGGTFNAPMGEAFFGAPYFQVTGGTFNPNGGTIVFDDGLTNFTIPTTFTLNNVTVNKTSSLRFITNSSTLVVTGTLTLTNGSIENTAAIGTVEAQGDVVMASTYDGGDANFRFGGSANQTYTNAGGVNPQGTWKIDKSGGVLILASNLILGTSQALNITSGELSQGTAADLRAGTITVGATGRWRNNGTGDITLGGNVANSGEIDIDGTTVSCDEADSILIRSSSAGVQRNWSGTGSFFVQDADVQDQAGTAAITVHAGTNSGNNGGNWTFDPTCAPFVWDGGGATNNWSEAANWRRNLLPLASTVVLFNGTSVKDSVVDTSYSVDGVQVNSGYSGTLSWSGGNILTVGSLGFVQNAGIVLAGVLTVNGNTTISGGEFTSAAAAIKDFNGDLTISNASFTGPSSATTFISGNFNLTTPTSYSPGSSVRFDGGSSTTVTVPSNTQFNLFAIDKTGSASVSITGGSNVIVNGNLFLMDGLLNGDLIEVRGRFDVLTGFDGGNGAVIIQNLPIGQLSTIQSDAVLPQFVTVNSANCNLSVANLAGTVTFQNLTLQNGTIAASSTLASSIIVIGNYSQSGGTFSYGSFAGQSMTVNGDFSLIGGIFRPLAASLVDLNGDVTLTGGTFTANSGDLTIAANFSRSGSNTFNHNGGRVIFDGSTDRNLSLPDVPFTTVFNDVRFDSPNSTFIDSSVSTFTAFITAGELEFADGFVVSAPARSIVEARGDVVIGGGLDNGISTTIKFGGNAAQSFTDNGGFESFDITLDKSGGTVNLLSDLDLAVALNDQTLDLANGTITTGANRVIVGGDDTLINGNGFVVGNLEQQFTTGTSTVFNVGTADGPSPVTVNVIAAAANVMGGGPASLTISATQGIRPGMHPLMSVGRFWTITETGDITADLTFNYPQGDANGNEALFGLFRWNGTTNTAVTGNLDTVANTFFTAGVSEFSDWTIGTLVPTAAPASISGRVTDPFGRGLRGVVILAQGSDGVTRSAVTNTFGHYKVEGLAAGQTCVLSASSRRYSFANNFRLVDLSADVSNEDFVATR